MTDKKVRRRTKKKQRRDYLPRIDHLVAALYWIVKTILLIIEWFTR